MVRQRKSISIIDRLKRVDSRNNIDTRLSASPLHFQFVKYSNIRGQIADLTRQTYRDVRFDKSTIRHRIFEYSDLTESKCHSLDPTCIARGALPPYASRLRDICYGFIFCVWISHLVWKVVASLEVQQLDITIFEPGIFLVYYRSQLSRPHL